MLVCQTHATPTYLLLISITGMFSDLYFFSFFFFPKEIKLSTDVARQMIVSQLCVQQSLASHFHLSQMKYLVSLLAVCPCVLSIFSKLG